MNERFLNWVESEASRLGYFGLCREPLMKFVRHVLRAEFIRNSNGLSEEIAGLKARIHMLEEKGAKKEERLSRQKTGWEFLLLVSGIYDRITLRRTERRKGELTVLLAEREKRRDCLVEEMEENVSGIEEEIKHEMNVAEAARELRTGNNNESTARGLMVNNNCMSESNGTKNSSDGQMGEFEETRDFESPDSNGFEDGFYGIPSRNRKDEEPAVRIAISNDKLKVVAGYENSKGMIKRSTNDIRKVKAKKGKISNQLKKLRQNVKVVEGILFIIVGIVFVLGEIEFSKYLLLKGFGLSHESLLGKNVLAAGIGLASVFLAFIYDQLREKGFINKNKWLRVGIRISIVVTVLLFIFFFLQLGYVRAVIFKYLMVSNEIDVYERLFREYPYLTPTAFIGISFMFLIGGAVLLSTGLRHLREASTFFSKKKELKVLSRTENKLKKEFETTIKDFNMIKVQFQFYSDENQVENLIQNQVEMHFYKYMADYERGKNKRERAIKDGIVDYLMAGNNGSSEPPSERFDLTVGRMLVNKAVNNFLNSKEDIHDKMLAKK